MSASYERQDPNSDNPYALRYSIRKHSKDKDAQKEYHPEGSKKAEC
jgi:hypothetical protein